LFGFVWLAFWLVLYRLPEKHPALTQRERELIETGEDRTVTAAPVPYLSLLGSRSVWAVILARLLADPIAWFYNYWIPEYLARTAGFTMADIGRYAWIPFIPQAVGILLGGVLSDRLYRRGFQLLKARLAVMLCGVLLMTSGILAAFPLPFAVTFTGISMATFGFGLWAPNMMSLCGEAFPHEVVGSVTGLSGVGASLGGMTFTLATGWLVDHFGYPPVFVLAAVMPLLAFVVLYRLLDRRAGS
jgi:ACS family hexuronate transporter-like MFS transporter